MWFIGLFLLLINIHLNLPDIAESMCYFTTILLMNLRVMLFSSYGFEIGSFAELHTSRTPMRGTPIPPRRNIHNSTWTGDKHNKIKEPLKHHAGKHYAFIALFEKKLLQQTNKNY